MVFINIDSTTNDILHQMLALADMEKDGILVCDRAGGIYSLNKIQSAGSLSSSTAEIEKIKEGTQPIKPEYQHQFTSEEFYDAGAANNYDIDKFIEETEKLCPGTISGEVENKNTSPSPETTPPTKPSEEQQEDKEAWDKLMKYIDDGMDPEEPISDEEWEEINRQYEEDMKLKEQEEQTVKKKRGRKKKENKDVF